MTTMDMNQIMARIAAFPGIPATLTRLMSLLEDPNVDAGEIEAVLRYDAGLTANILKLANSAYFGFANQVGSVRQAVVLLGARRMRQLVTTTCVNALMEGPVPGYELPAGELLRHSIAVSVTAEDLAGVLGIPQSDEVFTAALLHDVGKLVLGEFLAEGLDRVDHQTDPTTPFPSVERQILGADHAEVGAQILEHWSFPEPLVRAVRHHHTPDAADPPSTVIDIVHVSNVLCLMIGIGVGREGLQYAPSPNAVARLGLKTVEFERLASRTLQRLDELVETMDERQ
jgi:putative nucleotidyltransferase with HDIG domain